MTTKTNKSSAKTAEQNDDRYDIADAELRTKRVAYEEAVQAVEDAEAATGRALARLRQGDASVTAADLAAEPFMVRRAEALLDFAHKAWRREQKVGPIRPTVARLLAPYVEKALRVEVEVVDELTRASTAPATPTGYLKQGIRAVREGGGMLSCELVELAVVRDARFKSTDFGKLQGELDAAGFRVELRDRGTTGGGEVETATAELKVLAIAPAVMPLTATDPSDWEARAPFGAICTALAEGVGTVDLGSPGLVTDDKPRGPSGRVAAVRATHDTVKAERKVTGQKVDTTVTAIVDAKRMGDASVSHAQVQGIIRSTAEAMVGQPFAHLGHVEKATATVTDPAGPGGIAMKVSLTFAGELAA